MKMNNYALITGASSGIGYEFAKIFAREHYNLILSARSEDKLLQLKKEILEKYNVDIIIIPKDLSNPNEADELYWEIKKKNLSVDILINNAGFGTYGKFTQANLTKEIEMINLNIVSLVKLTYLFLQEMKLNGKGNIINVASTAAFQPGPLMSVYYATKSFVLSFSEAIANELKGSGIKVTALCPGPTESGFQAAAKITQSKLVKGRRLPSSKEVAEYGFDVMRSGKIVAVHGVINRIMTKLVKFLPRKLIVSIVRFIQEERNK